MHEPDREAFAASHSRSQRCLSLPQGTRDESYEVDEALAEQDATSLFEVLFSSEIQLALLSVTAALFI